MKTIKKAKLSLNRESLVELDSNFLRHARGGFEAPGDDGAGAGQASKSWIPLSCYSQGENANCSPHIASLGICK